MQDREEDETEDEIQDEDEKKKTGFSNLFLGSMQG